MGDRVRAWHPDVPMLREVYHASFAHSYPPHTHDDWAVMLVDRGAVTYSLDRAEHQATPTALTLLPPGIAHDGRPSVDGSGYRKQVLYLRGDWLDAGVAARIADRPTLTNAPAQTAARRVHAALAHPGDEMAAEHWLLAVRDTVLAHAGSSASARRDTPLARRLRAMLDDRYTESFTIAEAAAELGVHPSHLVRVFSATYGIAPHRYLVGRRVDAARRLLGEGCRPADVAARTGFHDQAHLARHFRRVWGVTPGAIRAA